MPFRAWCLAIALGLVCSSLQAQEQAGSRSERTDEQQDTAQAFGVPVRVVEEKGAAEAAERREAEAHKWQYEDLLAQKSMEAAAHSAKRAAWFSFGAVALGTALLIWSLDLMRRANRAATEAVAVTREIGEKQVKAYLSIHNAYATIYPERTRVIGGEDCIYWKISFEILNSGQSPALNISIYSGNSKMGQPLGAGGFDIQAGERIDRVMKLSQDYASLLLHGPDKDRVSREFFILAKGRDVFGGEATAKIRSLCQIEFKHGASANLVPVEKLTIIIDGDRKNGGK